MAGENATDPTVTLAPGVPPVNPTPTLVPAVDVSSIPDELLKDRLARNSRKTLEETLGVKTSEEAKAMKAELDAFKKADADAKAAAMTEQQRLETQLGQERANREAAEANLATERERNKLLQVATAKGVKNLDYAAYLVDKAKRDGGGSVDIDKVITDALGDANSKSALGILTDVAPPVAAAPANTIATTTTQIGGAPSPPRTAGGVPSKTARDMSPEEWRAHKKMLGMI